MPYQDQSSRNATFRGGCQLREAIQWLVQPRAFAEVRFRQDYSWTPWLLAAAAMLWAWRDEWTLVERFHTVRQIILNAFGVLRELAGSYQAFLKMLVRWTATLKASLLLVLRRRMKERFRRQSVFGRTIFGVDGSRIGVVRVSERRVAEMYRLGWGVEVHYRSFKQTFAHRKLRSHKGEHAQVELDWAMAGLWAACLYAQHCGCVPPRQLSVAKVLRVFRRTIRHAVPLDPEATLSELLKSAVVDDYARENKASRNYPRKKQDKPPGQPQILAATHAQAQLAKPLRQAKRVNGVEWHPAFGRPLQTSRGSSSRAQ